jgi:hypothetical protein
VKPRTYVGLYPWQAEVVDVARHRRDPFDGRHSTELLAFAVYLSHCGRASTGRGVTVARVRARFGERLTRRYLSVLNHSGYVEMTTAPARGCLGRPGRVAEYALTLPVAEGNAAHQDAQVGAAKTTPQVGSVVLSGDDDTEAGSRTTLPTAEHNTVAPLTDIPARASVRVLRISDPMLGNIGHRFASLVRVA